MLQKRAVFGIWVVAAVLSAGPVFGDASGSITEAPQPASDAEVVGAAFIPVGSGGEGQVAAHGVAAAKLDKVGTTANALELKVPAGIMIEAAQSCANSLDNARNACLEKFSPIIQGGMALLSGITTVVGSVKDQCSQSAENLNKAQNIMTLYNGACSGFKMVCEQRCKTAKAKAEELVKKECVSSGLKEIVYDHDERFVALTVPTVAAPYPAADLNAERRKIAVAKCQESSLAGQTAFVEAEKVCKDYQMNLMAAGAALAKILTDKAKAEKCKEESGTVDCTKDPTNASCNQKLDCSLAANSANPICICEKSPRSPGCGGSTNVSSTNDYMKNTGTPAPANALGGAPSSLGSGLNDSPYYGGGGSNGSGGGGLAGGGGGAGGGGSGAAKGTDGSNKGEKAALNANVLEGGGGGGGFRGGSGGGYNANDPYGKYKAYIPKDGNGRGLAGTTAADQVTGSNGLSNWEKVKAQYTNMKPTLLGR